VRTKQDILKLSQCSLAPRQGYRRVSIVEFLPLTTAIPAPAGAAPAHPIPPAPVAAKPAPAGAQAAASPLHRSAAPARAPRLGEVCPRCGAEVKARQLFSGTFGGCLC
jgi:hypothetical protein